jgi:hypothetical protein
MGGAETEHGDLCDRAADSGPRAISVELVRYRAHARFTTWAYKYVMDLELAGSQRAIFAAVTLGHLPPEALTCGLGPDRNAIYRALFEARRRVGSRLAADGFLQADDVLRQTASRVGWLRPLVAADPGDTG